jgi:ADP-heptose:LPS heptosyltransferase
VNVNDIDRLGKPQPGRIAIFRALPGLGDLLCAVPALRALRFGLPDAHITLIGLSSARTFVQRYNQYLDELIEFPGYPGLPEQPPALEALPPFFSHVQARRFDLALQLHGSGTISNPITVLLGARLSAGFYLPGEYCPDPDHFLPFADHESEIRRNLRLVTYLGIPAQGEQLEFPIAPGDREALAGLPAATGLEPDGYVCVHPGARSVDRRWPAERFAAVADDLARRGLRVVLTGTADEAPVTQAVARAMHMPVIDLAGQTSLGAMAVLLRDARLLVCNDTGISHLAAALGVPSVVIFTTTDPNRWAPLDRDCHRVVTQPAEAAGLGSLDISRVTLDAVLAEVNALLEGQVADAA